MAAATHAPGYKGPKVKAIAPIMGWTDLVQALVPNDVMKASYDLGLFAAGYKAGKQNYNTDLPLWLVEGLTGVNEAEFKQQLALRSVVHQADFLRNVPIYALQAWKDELFPVEQVRTLFDTIRDENRNLKLYAGGFGSRNGNRNLTERLPFFSCRILRRSICSSGMTPNIPLHSLYRYSVTNKAAKGSPIVAILIGMALLFASLSSQNEEMNIRNPGRTGFLKFDIWRLKRLFPELSNQ
ncbi:hypothetical protein EFBL_1923 [Effusibacillus lacus]|uniref:Uncharacterized protein n=1 Tax=Effusibacillus lacus TaxID=1348429 RepID=A0A292YHF7_9BACL|nr:hypothetical protein EFBL_1923 [Effusibacillus lacus]